MIDQTIFIPNSSSKEVYEVLMDSKKHSKLIGDEAEVDPVVGGTFSTFGGYADGENVELVPGKTIKQTWRASDWPDGHYSTITFSFTNKDEGTEIHFTQENEPDGTQEEFESGWADFYWNPLLKFF